METKVESKFNKDMWSVLEKIKDGLLRQIGKDNIITYSVVVYPLSKDPTVPHPTKEQLLIEKLIEAGVAKEVGDRANFEHRDGRRRNPKTVGLSYHLRVIKAKFNPYYTRYKRGNEKYASKLPFDWKPELKKNSGILVLPDKSTMTFRGGNFGGLNILFENLGRYIKREALKVAISEHHQQGKQKSLSDIVIAEWKGELKKNRGKLFVYFDIEHLEPDSYRLIYKDQQ